MGTCGKVLFLIVLGLSIFIGIKLNSLFEVPPLPKLENTWWGPGQPSKVDTSIKPFKINVSEKVLTDLKQRLQNARPFTQPLEGIQQQYGMNTNLLAEIVEFWKTKYNWREREAFLNQYPQFTTNIQGLNIHFIHVKPAKTDGLKVLPLLLLHGWPGSIREFYDVIPKLTTARKGQNFVFELIIPSLPGYGFSDNAVRPGLGAAQMGVVFKNLMGQLGFKKFYIQGGDWGAIITANMAALFPEQILGMHSNMCFARTPLYYFKLFFGSFHPAWVVNKEFEHRVYPASKQMEYLLLETGYMHLQATKPDTVGTALNDSPVGLAAYILEKFTTWTNPAWKEKADGGLKEKYTYTNLLDNVMIYWVTNSITTSQRLYAETFNKAQFGLNIDSQPITVPSACLKFEHEISYFPDSFLKSKYVNLVHSADVLDGGHFAAFEVPDVVANDVWKGIGKMEKYYNDKK